MALTALIAAYQESDEPGGPLRAILPLAGRTLIERQARLAALAGATRILVLVERVPPELLVADGFIGDESHVRRIAAAPPLALLTVPDARVDDRFERIDAGSRWAGLAMIDGALLRETAAMLRDWDPQSTLLRRAVQGGADMHPVLGEAADAQLTIAERVADLARVHRQIVDRAAAGRGDWISYYLLGPVERAATHALMPTGVTPRMIGLGAMLLTGLGFLAFVWHFLWLGLALMLLATPLDGIAERLARLRLEESIGHSWWSHLLPALAGAALLALGLSLARAHGWGAILLSVAMILFLLAQRFEVEGRRIDGLLFLAERKGMTWLMLPFAVAGVWLSGLVALFGFAVASFFWAQRRVHTAAPAKDQD